MAVNPQMFADGFEDRMQCLMDQYRNMEPVCSSALCSKENKYNKRKISKCSKKKKWHSKRFSRPSLVQNRIIAQTFSKLRVSGSVFILTHDGNC